MTLPTVSPRAAGVAAQGISALLDALEARRLELHSLMIARHGAVLAQGWWAPYDAARLHLYYSCSKAFTATAIGLLVDEGTVALDDAVVDHLPWADLATARDDVDRRWAAVQVQHCLSMTVGHADDAWSRVMQAARGTDPPSSADWLDHVLADPPTCQPGTVFAYNQVATYLLARVIEHRSGQPLLDVLRHRLLDPLGIGEMATTTDPQGHAYGFSGVHGTTSALLALAQLYLQRGRWGGRQLLSETWVDAATRPFIPYVAPATALGPEWPDWTCGYGFAMWIARHGYRGDGAYGQYAVVLPEQDMVVAITAEVIDMQDVLDLLWAHLLPAIGHPGDAATDEALATRLSTLALPARGDDGSGPAAVAARRAGGDVSAAWSVAHIEREGDGHRLTIRIGDALCPVRVGNGTWTESTVHAAGATLPVVASGGWRAGNFAATIRLIETPHSLTVRGPADALTMQWRMMPLSGADPLWSAWRRE